jgi:flagellar biosynthesis protein FliQ
MNEAEALDLVQEAIWTVIIASGPTVGAAMVVGLIISLLQALTQVQEVTLTFIPKIVVVFIALTFMGYFIGGQIYAFTENVYSRIEDGF